MKNQKISRKEVATLVQEITGVEVSVAQVRFNEIKWGIKAARGIDLNKRTVRYDREKVVEAIRSRFS